MLRNFSRLKITKKPRQLNEIHDPILDLYEGEKNAIEDTITTTDKNSIQTH